MTGQNDQGHSWCLRVSIAVKLLSICMMMATARKQHHQATTIDHPWVLGHKAVTHSRRSPQAACGESTAGHALPSLATKVLHVLHCYACPSAPPGIPSGPSSASRAGPGASSAASWCSCGPSRVRKRRAWPLMKPLTWAQPSWRPASSSSSSCDKRCAKPLRACGGSSTIASS